MQIQFHVVTILSRLEAIGMDQFNTVPLLRRGLSKTFTLAGDA